MAKPGSAKGTDSKQTLKNIAKALLLIALAAGAFYLGLTVYAMRNSHTAVCLAIPSEDGLLVYKYCMPEKRPGSPGDSQGSNGKEPQAPHDNPDWVKVEFGAKVRFLDAAGKPSSVDDIYGNPPEKTVAKMTTGPDGKIVRISGVPGSFCVQGVVEERESGEITIQKTKYTVDDPETFSGEQGDVVKLHGFNSRAILAEIVSKAGSIHISTNVDGARVFLDGVYKGKSPVGFKAAPGLREVMAKSDGYKTTKIPVNVESKKQSEVLIELPPITGAIDITSTPSNAEIYINGDLKGITNSKLLLPPGDYDVMVKLPGYYPKKARLRLLEDIEVPLNFELVKEIPGISSGIGITPGGSMGGQLPGTGSGEIPGTRVTVLSYDPGSRILKALGSRENRVDIEVPEDVFLENLPFGRASWDRLLPGEEISLETGVSGRLQRAIRTYSHTFSASGKVLSKDGSTITLGDNWLRCTLSSNALVQHLGRGTLSGTLDVGDSVTVHGASAGDIRYVHVSDSLGEKSSFEGHLVKTTDGLEIFGDSAVMWFKVDEDLDVVDHGAQKTDKASAVPSGSRLRFYMNHLGDIVWAEYVWKANVSVEGKIALLTGPVVSIAPSWQDVTISHDTTVFAGKDKRPFYDIRIGDTVLAAGPSQANTCFIWIQDRIEFDTTVEGFMGAAGGKEGRVFHEIERAGGTTPWIVDTNLTFAYPKERRSLSSKEVNRGDRVRLWLGAGGKPVWGEVIERNQVNLTGHYLGEAGGLLYFTGFAGFTPAKNLTIIGLSGSDELQKGSLVHIGGQERSVNYIEVDSLVEPVRWVDGTVILIDRNVIKVKTSRYYVTEYQISKDTWYVDWDARIDGSAQDLKPGDKVSIGISSYRQALFIERDYSPRFKAGGIVTAVSGRTITISGDYGTLRAVTERDAIVYKDGEITSYQSIRNGDKVQLAGPSADLVNLVVCNP